MRTDEARVYVNRGTPVTVPFADATPAITVFTGDTAGADIKGYVTLGTDPTDAVLLARVMGAAFTHSATQTHTYDTLNDAAFTTRGTYAGAPGVFRCTGTCSSTNDGMGSPSALNGTWHFKPDAGVNAMTSQPDTDYLYYGWWVRKDDDGMPTAASAFRGVVGTAPATTATPILLSNGVALTGSATYNGHAAGKFAIDNVLDGTGNGGHFTADAMLTAKFGAIAAPNNGGVSGTIDNFRLNDGSEDPGWSVALHLAPWGTDGAFATPAADVATTEADETMGTTWSIGDAMGDRSGTWSGQAYDELPGSAADTPAGDGSTIPTTLIGTFYSEMGSIGRMVGGFGADKQ